MRLIRLLGVVTIVLTLIIAAGVPASAGRDKPPKEKPTKVVPKEPPGQERKKPPKPKHTPRPGNDQSGKVTICHKPGTPAEKTLTLPESAVPGHLGHGDVEGPCSEAVPTPTVTATMPITPTHTPRGTMTICHKPGTPAEKTLTLPESAVSGHLGHGDVEGPCSEVAPTPTVTATVPITPTHTPRGTMTICHKPGTPAEKTLTLPESAVPGHLGHGDAEGTCSEVTPAATVTCTRRVLCPF